VAYTFSKALDNGTSSWFGGAVQGIYHPETSYGLSSYNQANILTFWGGWDLPFGTGHRWLNRGAAKWVAGNWQFELAVQHDHDIGIGDTLEPDGARGHRQHRQFDADL
jgi:hypothetical protein